MMQKQLTRRDFLKAGSLLSVGAIIASCTPAPANESDAPEDSPAESTAPDSEKVTVEFMNWWGAQREEIMNVVIERFHEANPDIQTNNAVQPWDNRAERAATAIASSNPPSLIMVPRVETYKFAHEGLIIPITDYVKASGLECPLGHSLSI